MATRSRRPARRRGPTTSPPGGFVVPDEPLEPPADADELPCVTGVLDVRPEGYGFVRTAGFTSSAADAYVAASQITRLALRPGDRVTGRVRPARGGRDTSPAMVRVDLLEDDILDDNAAGERPWFDTLPAPFPTRRVPLAGDPNAVTARIVDLLAPIGYGQRGMVVAPPKAGKTRVLREIAAAVAASASDIELIVLNVDERPEEAYAWAEEVGERGVVVASTFDRPTRDHLAVAELVLERAKRRVERGAHVMILLDSLTRLARAYNTAAPSSGRILTGGVESTALDPPKRFFGSARNVKDGGSLTIIASCLVETGSRMDEVIFEEFKGRGNWEVRLDRGLAEKRVFPAISLEATGTRNDELLVPHAELAATARLRRALQAVDGADAVAVLLKNVAETATNEEFLDRVSRVGA